MKDLTTTGGSPGGTDTGSGLPWRFARHRRFVLSRLPILVLCVLLAAAAGYVISASQRKTYEASATLIVGKALQAGNADLNQLLASQSVAKQWASIAMARPHLDAVIERLGLSTDAEDLRTRVRATASLDTTLLTISAQDPDPALAADMANALADDLMATSQADGALQSEVRASLAGDISATQAQIKTTQDRIGTLSLLGSPSPQQQQELIALNTQLAGLRATLATLITLAVNGASSQLTSVERAVPPTTAVAPRPAVNALLAALVGLLFASGLLFLPRYLDDSVVDPADLEGLNDLVSLGKVTEPAARPWRKLGRGKIRTDLSTLVEPRSAATEAYRGVRWNIEFLMQGTPVHTILAVSTKNAEGKTLAAANLAVVFAQAGLRVLIVDADLRRPSIHLHLGLTNLLGLTTLLTSADANPDLYIQATPQQGLDVLTAGPRVTNPTEILGAARMRQVLTHVGATYDLVVVDGPPLDAYADGLVLSSIVDRTLFVIDIGRTKRQAVRRDCEQLLRAHATILGAVFISLSGRSYTDYPGPKDDTVPADLQRDLTARSVTRSARGSAS